MEVHADLSLSQTAPMGPRPLFDATFRVLAAWPGLAGRSVRPLSGGLINTSFVVEERGQPLAVLQRLNPIFGAEVHLDIEAITQHLVLREVPTPRLIPTVQGAPWHEDAEGGVWRALTWVPGHTVHRLADPAMAREAGAAVGRWHAATADLEHAFHFTRPGAHDTPAHMERARAALGAYPGHRLRDAVAPVIEGILEGWRTWEGRLDLPPRIVHGDLKVSNLRFDDEGRALALIDLDTVSSQPLDVELGDAWRSWCNRAGEDEPEADLDLALLEAAIAGYLSTHPLPPSLREALGGALERIALELAARFALDALEERYFGWSESIAPTRGEHNLLRAQGQLSLARAARAARAGIDRTLR